MSAIKKKEVCQLNLQYSVTGSFEGYRSGNTISKGGIEMKITKQ